MAQKFAPMTLPATMTGQRDRLTRQIAEEKRRAGSPYDDPHVIAETLTV